VRGDGTALTEVQAIAHWLGRANPRAKLWPEGIEAETRAIEAMAYIVGTVHGQGFARIFATSTFARNPSDHDAVRGLGRDIIVKGFSVLDATLGESEYVVGRYSVADPILFYVEFWADKTDIPLPPALMRHYRCMLARSAVRRVLREEGYNLATLGKQTAVPAVAL
jgi:glutathione S-transferase